MAAKDDSRSSQDEPPSTSPWAPMALTLGTLGVTGAAAGYLAYRHNWQMPTLLTSEQAKRTVNTADPLQHIQFPNRTSRTLLYFMGYEIHPQSRIEISYDPAVRNQAFRVANRALAVSLAVTGSVGAVLVALLKAGFEEKAEKEQEEARRRQQAAREAAQGAEAVAVVAAGSKAGVVEAGPRPAGSGSGGSEKGPSEKGGRSWWRALG